MYSEERTHQKEEFLNTLADILTSLYCHILRVQKGGHKVGRLTEQKASFINKKLNPKKKKERKSSRNTRKTKTLEDTLRVRNQQIQSDIFKQENQD